MEPSIATIRKAAEANMTAEVYKKCFASLDLTSLNTGDTAASVAALTQKVVDFGRTFPHLPNVAALCVWPNFVEVAGVKLGDNPSAALASVAGGFPSSQTFLEVKMLECSMAQENGADEIDIVMDCGGFLVGEYGRVADEIRLIKAEVGDEVVLKVIVESGLLADPGLIGKAAALCLDAGADFIKTSTGKGIPGATPEAAAAMCSAIRGHYDKTGIRKGFKASGGIRTVGDAVLYYTLVEQILGPAWLIPDLFRLGASSLANELLSAIEGRAIAYF